MTDYSVFGPWAGAAFATADMDREDKLRRQTQNALADYNTNPDQAITNYMAVDAPSAIAFLQKRAAADAENTQRRALAVKAMSDAAGERQKLALSALAGATTSLRAIRDKGGDVGAGFDQLDQAGILDTMGMTPQEKAQYRAAITTNPAILDAIAARVPEGVVIDHNLVDKNTGNIMRTVPRAPEFKIIPNGTGGSSYGVYDPNTGGFGNGAPATGAGLTPGGAKSSSGDPYNIVLGNGKYGTPPNPLTSMTLGQVYDFGRNTLIPNSRAAGVGTDSRGTIGSSASGAYQITGETLSRVAPIVLGPNWRDQQFTPQVQDALGEAVYNDAVSRGVPLNKVWASLSPAQAKILAGRPWAQVRDIIIKSETGGGAAPQSTAAPAVPGFTILGQTAPKPEKKDAPAGYRWKADGSLEFIPGGPADPAVKPQGGGPTRQQIGLAKQKLVALRAIENQLDRVQQAYDSAKTKGFVGPGWGRVPFSGAFDSESATLDKSIAQIAPLIRSLTRVPGEGSMSDYESKLAEMSLPSRQDNEAGFKEAITGLRELIAQTRAGYGEILAPAGGATPSASTSPSAAGAPGSSQQNPIPIRTAQDAIKNSGKWVRTPDGRVGRAK